MLASHQSRLINVSGGSVAKVGKAGRAHAAPVVVPERYKNLAAAVVPCVGETALGWRGTRWIHPKVLASVQGFGVQSELRSIAIRRIHCQAVMSQPSSRHTIIRPLVSRRTEFLLRCHVELSAPTVRFGRGERASPDLGMYKKHKSFAGKA
jgi:hypothetical protein